MADGEYKRLCSIGTCGGKHKAQGYCQRHYRQVQRGGLNEYRPQPCAHCGEQYTPEQHGTMYCSKRCKHAAWVEANPDCAALNRQKEQKMCAVYAGYCEECGGSFVSRRERKFCSYPCESKANHKKYYVSQAPLTRTCRCCGVVFNAPKAKTRPEDFCSGKCKASARRAHKAKRKLTERTATIENVDPFRVFDRDGWRCQLCGVKTPKAKRATYEPNAPELDHIIPLAKGGEHSYRNTQCACRKCNGAKSDKPLGQLLLVG